MYKCENCGNTYKFLGTASEKGTAFIYQNQPANKKPPDYSWIYCISDRTWSSDMKIRKCFYCKSCKIIKV